MVVVAAAFVALLATAAFIWRDDILRTALDPKQPFQTYKPPPPPNYSQPDAWGLPRDLKSIPGGVDIFFVHPTTYDGGREWNGPINNRQADHTLQRMAIPNYAGPFARVGRVFAPRYRQGSLYTQMSLREDAKAAREFAYGDVAQAFETWRTAYGGARPFILVGVEQGALMASRLLKERIASDPALKARLVGAYLQRAVIPAEDFAPGSEIPACGKRDEAGCVVGWNEVYEGDDDLAESLLTRALVWGKGGELVSLAGRPALCVNPITGGLARPSASAKDNLGAVNATGLEWGARPAFTRGEVGAACIDGLLRVTAPSSGAFHVSGSWADRSKVPGYNLFYADIEIDALKRTAEWRRRTGTR